MTVILKRNVTPDQTTIYSAKKDTVWTTKSDSSCCLKSVLSVNVTREVEKYAKRWIRSDFGRSNLFWTDPKCFRPVFMPILDRFKTLWTCSNYALDWPKQIGLTKIVLDLSIEWQGNSVLAPLYDHKLQNGVYFDYHQTLNLYADTGIPSNTVLSWKYARCIIWQYINCVSQH